MIDIPYAKVLLTTDGASNGILTVTSTTDLVKEATVFLASNTVVSKKLIIDQIISGTEVAVKDADESPIYNRYDCSAYLVADGANLVQPAQSDFYTFDNASTGGGGGGGGGGGDVSPLTVAGSSSSEFGNGILINDDADMSANFTSDVINTRGNDGGSIELIFQGTATGTFEIQTSLDYDPDDPGTSPGTWVPLVLSATPTAAGVDDSILIELMVISFPYLRVVFTSTGGAGDLDIWFAGKAD